MSCDLERTYSELATKLPEDPDSSETFMLDESVIPVPPPEISTDRIVIKRSRIQVLPGCRTDYLELIAPRPVFRQLGLLALAVLFHEQCDRVTVHLTNPASHVKHIVFEYNHWNKTQVTGFWTRPWVLGYLPEEASHALSTDLTDLQGAGAPLLRLTNLRDCQESEEEWENRDTLKGLGGIRSTAEVAEFLLNVGRSNAKLGQFSIPANRTFFAAEVTLWVPEEWDQLRRRLAELSQRPPSPAKSEAL